VQAAFQRHNAAPITKHGHDPNNCPDCQRIGVLGNNPMSLTPSAYVGALVEVEFLSNPDVVEDFLMRPDAVDVIARGLASGVLQFFHAG
jgi:N-acetylmuramoyl-L-alanine amidase